jgi:hypothetical protein
MSEEPKPEQFINIEGPPGQSVFTHLVTWLIPREYKSGEFQKELDEYWAHFKDLADERAVVLAGALCVEDCLDGLINAFFPASKIVYENRDFTFSSKIDVIRASRLILPRILRDCDTIRKLRNDFAHELKLKTLSDWGDEKFQAVDEAIRGYQPSHDVSVPLRERFQDLVGFVCVALKAYTTHVQMMRRFLDSADFMKSLKKFAEKENVA